MTSAKTGCTDPQPTGGDPTKFNFAFWTCTTPTVTSIDKRNGTVQTTITLTGEGFSTTDCQNEISIAGYTCTTTSSTENLVTCQMAKSGEPALGILQPFSVRVGNRGNALINIMAVEDRSFGVLPNIESISPLAGSMAGGATMTITGFGFGNAPLVTIGNNPCSIVSSTYTEIICNTPSSGSQNSFDVTVNAYVNGSPLPASCETSAKTCKYSYANLWTPTLTNINPSSMNGSTTFTVSGARLGTSRSEVDVSIGGVSATVNTVSDISLEGTISGIPAGNSDVIVKVKDYGQASGTLTVVGNAVISNISPSSGSIHGRTSLTITGNGFVANQTTVSLDGNVCTIQSTSLSQVVCLTPAHAAGTVSISVTSKGVNYPATNYNYSTDSTPTVTSVSPSSGLSGDSITISGSSLAGTSVSVSLDGVVCTVTSSSSLQIVCTLGNHGTGSVPIEVYVSDLGVSNTDVNFEYQLSLTSVSPSSGKYFLIVNTY